MYSILIQFLFNNKKHTFTEHSALIFIHGVNKLHYGFGVNRIHRRERINKLLIFLKVVCNILVLKSTYIIYK